MTYNAESAVNILQDVMSSSQLPVYGSAEDKLTCLVVEDQSGKEYKMDAYQVRFPTNVSDVGRVLVHLTRKLL